LLTGGNMLRGDFLNSTGRVLTPCVLGAWILWKHRNACVFEGASTNLQVVQAFKESHLWQFSGAKKLTALSPEMGVVQA